MRTTSTVILLIFFAASAWAQLTVNINPGSINYAEGQVYVDGKPLQVNPGTAAEIKKWQDLRTGTGKAEIQLGLATTLWLGEQGRLRMNVELIEKFDYLRLAFHVGDAVVELNQIGFYRIDSNPPRCRVYNGLAEIVQKRLKAKIKPGRSADLDSGLKVSHFSDMKDDPLQTWATRRSEILFREIKQVRFAAFMQQQQMDRMLQRQIEEKTRQDTYMRIQQYQQNEIARIYAQQQALSGNH
jgi:hypothetical protein